MPTLGRAPFGESAPTRKKRAGCGGGGGGNGNGDITTIDNFMKDKIKNVIENEIKDSTKDKIKEMFDKLKRKVTSIEDFMTDRVNPVINSEIKEILGRTEDKISIATIKESKIKKVERVIKDKIKAMVERKSPVTFRARWPRFTMPKLPTMLLVHLYTGISGEKESDAKLSKYIKQINKLDYDSVGPVCLKNGTKILIRPEMPGFRFTPEESTVKWYGNFIPLEFHMKTEFKGRIPNMGKKVHGQVSFFVGPLPIAEIKINVIIKKQLTRKEKFIKDSVPTSGYQKIFASYSRKDSEIVEKVEKAYNMFGDEYIRDLMKLRSGEEWQPAILNFIKEADVFHLYWSKASKKSENVKKEWRAALNRRKENFIRPVYWEIPKPKCPYELKNINFKYVPL